MRATAVVSCTLVLFGALAPAAPVPKHLMPKEPPFSFPAVKGTKWVYDRGGNEETHVITSAEAQKGGGTLVTVEREVAGNQTQAHQKLLITEREWFLVEETGQPYDPPWSMFKLPLGEDRTCEFDVSRADLGARLKGTKTQAGRTEQLKLPAGTFDAVKVETRDAAGGPGISVTHWHASGVGLVQISLNQPYLTLKAFVPGR